MTQVSFAQHALPKGILPKIAKLAFPVALQSALVAILALADVLMVSDFGQAATAAVGIASKWHFVAIMVMAGLSAANGILVSQYWGKKDKIHAKTVTIQTLICGCIIMVPVTLAMTLGAELIMQLQSSDADVIRQGAMYLWYSIPLLILTHIIITIESTLRSADDAMLPLILGAITIAINICLNFVLIKGGFGIPAMGVAGAALATTIARLLQVGLIYAVLAYRQHWLIVSNWIRKHHTLWMSYKKLAVPQAINTTIWAFGTLTYQVIIGHMGTTELAVFSMLAPFESLCFSAFFGIAMACSVLTGQSLGRNEFDIAQSVTRFFIKIIFVMGVGCSLLIYANRELILEWLNLTNPEYLDYSMPAITVISAAIWIKMLNLLIIVGILRSGGDNNFCLRMDFFAMWIIGVPVTACAAFIGELSFGWVYAAMLSEEVIKLTLCARRYVQYRWVNNLTITA